MTTVLESKQLEGMAEVRALGKKTNHYGFVETPYGRMYLGGRDDGIAMRYLHGYVYEPVSMEIWSRRCAGADLVADVGAHTGIYALAAFKAGAKRVMMFEPYYLNAARLVLNLTSNHRPTDDVIVAAASSQFGLSVLHVPMSHGTGHYCTTASTVDPKGHRSPFGTILTTLDRVIRTPATILKLDVEFHVAKVLQGATELLTHQPDIILEVFEDGITEILEPLGYHFWLIDERKGVTRAESMVAQEMFAYRRNYFASVEDNPAVLEGLYA